MFGWTVTKGLRRDGMDGPIYGTAPPGAALEHVESSRIEALYHFKGLHPHLTDPLLIGRLRDAAAPFRERQGAIVLTGTVGDISRRS